MTPSIYTLGVAPSVRARMAPFRAKPHSLNLNTAVTPPRRNQDSGRHAVAAIHCPPHATWIARRQTRAVAAAKEGNQLRQDRGGNKPNTAQRKLQLRFRYGVTRRVCLSDAEVNQPVSAVPECNIDNVAKSSRYALNSPTRSMLRD